MRRARVLSLAALLGFVLPAVLVAAPATGALVERGEFHDEFTEVIEDFCDVPGLTVTHEAVVDVRFRVIARGREKLPYYAENVRVTSVFTNPETGLSVRSVETVLSKDLFVEQDGDILTIVVLSTGNATAYGPDGKAIARNPGQVRFRLVIDSNGTLNDPFDDIVLSFEQIKGSTGRSDDFCEAAVEALQGPDAAP